MVQAFFHSTGQAAALALRCADAAVRSSGLAAHGRHAAVFFASACFGWDAASWVSLIDEEDDGASTTPFLELLKTAVLFHAGHAERGLRSLGAG
jgi:hypothetical protein